MTKKQVFKIIGFVLTISICVVCLAFFLNFNKKEECVRVYGFYAEEKDSIDVMMIGSSELYRGYLAPLAYEESGFTSYAMSLSAMPSTLYKSIFKECRKNQDAQLYVFEINGVYYEDQYQDARLREWFDNMPYSDEKTKDIKEVIPEDSQSSYYINFEKYHSNWYCMSDGVEVIKEKNLIKDNGYTYMKGYYAWFMSEPNTSKKQKYRHMSEDGKKNMTALLEYCKSEGIDNVVFVRWPHRNETEDSYQDAKKLVAEYGYDFVDFNEYVDEIGIDSTVDYADNEHLNPIGTEKMTKYYANYIKENYNIETKHSKKIDEEWTECAQKATDILEVCKEKTTKNEHGHCWKEKDFIKMLEKKKN